MKWSRKHKFITNKIREYKDYMGIQDKEKF